MNLKLRKLPPQPQTEPTFPGGAAAEDEAPRDVRCRNVPVASGIHNGRFPIGGMRVRVRNLP